MSLKNSVGLIANRVRGVPYDYMAELHLSPRQRLMIAEINRFYRTDLVVMDALRAFIDGGPEQGKVVEPGLILASRDRVALDAVGVAILRYYGAKKSVAKGRIFDLQQIHRAAELGVGVSSFSKITLRALNDPALAFLEEIAPLLRD